MITKTMMRWAALFAATALTSVPGAQAADLCQVSGSGYVIGFFNAPWSSRIQAELGLSVMRDSLYGSTYNNETLDYELFYNQTASSQVGISLLDDLGGAFETRTADLGGALAGRWELFWETLGSAADQTYKTERLTLKLKRLGADFTTLLQEIEGDSVTHSANAWSTLLSNPPAANATGFATQSTRIKSLISERKKLLLTGHGPGDLFTDLGYDAALAVTGTTPNNVKAIFLAPATSDSRGNYVLADADQLIGVLRTQGVTGIPASNATLPATHLLTEDFSGHKLVESYLNPVAQTAAVFRSQIQTALDSLVAPTTAGSTGFFTVTLTWDGSGDVDLHTFVPSGNLVPNGAHIYYSNEGSAGSSTGFLDTDNTSEYGPEHYFSTCDSTLLQTGSYQIGVNNFGAPAGRIATVQVANAVSGVIFTKQMVLEASRGSAGDSSPTPVVKVLVSDDGNGHFSAVTQ